jgi:hypothetical protein
MKSTRSAFERQILESVLIQTHRKKFLMNNMADYNRCALPRLTAKLAEKGGIQRDSERSKNRREDQDEEKGIVKEESRARQEDGARAAQEKEDKI